MNIFLEKLKTKLINIKGRIIKHKVPNLATWCSNYGYDIFENETELSLKNQATGQHIVLRRKGSDIAVFQQVFIEKEYTRVINIIKRTIKNPKLIIDCGANIGLTSIKLAENFPSSSILTIEPEFNNYHQLSKNTPYYENIKAFHNAVWSEKCQITMDDKFRDGLDWSKQTIPSSSGGVTALQIKDFINYTEFDQIDFLKIDVEVAEKELFKDVETASFLSKTKLMALEIHDEYNCRNQIYKVLDA